MHASPAPVSPERHGFDLRRNLRLFYVMGFARDFTPLLAVWVIYLTDFRHLTLSQVALMEAMFWGVKLVMEVPSGAIADRFGRRNTFILGQGFELFGTLIFALAGDYTLLTISYVLWSAGLAFRSGNDEAYLYDTLIAGEREPEYSDRIGLYWSLGTVASMAGAVAGGVLAEVTTLQVAILAAVTPFLMALPLTLAMQEPPRMRHERHLGLMETLTTGLGEVRRNDALRNIIFLEVSLVAALPAYVLLGQPFLEKHDVPLALFGVLAIPVQLARIGGSLVAGRLTRRIGLTATLMTAVGLTVGGLVILAAVDSVIAFAGMAIAFAGPSLAFPAIGAYINERTESRIRATVLSVAQIGTSLTMGAAALGSGTIGSQSLQASFAAMAVVVLAGSVLSMLAWMASHGPSLASEQAVVEV